MRDIVFVLKSGFEIVKRCQKDLNLAELSEILIVSISTMNYTENPFHRNHTKLVVELLFCVALASGDDQFLQTCLDSVYTVFKAQIGVAHLL